jgi:peptidoglycan/LPS O-acetylase OafA/YrhL
MPLPLRSRLSALLARAPLAALRDVVDKPTTQRTPIAALDGVRGLAVLIVVAAHAGGLEMLGHGAAGVWLFFCLSAFLLTLPYAHDPASLRRPGEMRRYAARRVRRIFPAYLATLALYALVKDWSLEVFARHLVFLRADGILWTIPQELLFYALLPLLALLHPLLFRGRFPITLLAFAALATASNLWLDRSVFGLHGNGKILPFHLGIFATGMGFAYASAWPALARLVERPGVNRALGILGLVLLAALCLTSRHFVAAYASALPWLAGLRPNWANHYPGSIGLLCGTIVYLSVACRGRWLGWAMGSLFLRALGVVSFSLYLVHYLVRNEIASQGFPLGNILFALNLAAAYAIACVSYGWIERPLMKTPRRPASANTAQSEDEPISPAPPRSR